MTVLERMRDLIQCDVGRRGLCADPERNLINACPHDFRLACESLASPAAKAVGIVTGFFIPTGQPPSGETDGPLGALFLARALAPLGIRVVIATDDFCAAALRIGIELAGLRKSVALVVLPTPKAAGEMAVSDYAGYFRDRAGDLTHLLAIERVGPSHTAQSLRGSATIGDEACARFANTIAAERHDRCHTMRGRDITNLMSPAHRLFEAAESDPDLVTIGIGDGGNEIGMGKIAWDVIERNIPGGGQVACRIATRHLIVCGISNWGAYGLAAGVRMLRGAGADPDLFSIDKELAILEAMVERGPLVDGVTGLPTATVDGLSFAEYAKVLSQLEALK